MRLVDVIPTPTGSWVGQWTLRAKAILDACSARTLAAATRAQPPLTHLLADASRNANRRTPPGGTRSGRRPHAQKGLDPMKTGLGPSIGNTSRTERVSGRI